MYECNENPVDCFNWRVLFANFIVEDIGEPPILKIELDGLYKEGSTIDLDKLNNVSRFIEDRMNGRGGKVKMSINDHVYDYIIDAAREYDKAMNELGTKGIESELEAALKRRMSNFMYGAYSNHVNCNGFIIPEIKNVIFNPPATIVFWNDGTKTVVKCQNYESFDPEKGITMAFFKKMHGNKGHYFEEIKKWTEKYECPVKKEVCEDSKWHIWYRIGTTGDIHCYEKDYGNYFHAIKMARKIASEAKDDISWTVSKKVPFGPKGDDTEWHYN